MEKDENNSRNFNNSQSKQSIAGDRNSQVIGHNNKIYNGSDHHTVSYEASNEKRYTSVWSLLKNDSIKTIIAILTAITLGVYNNVSAQTKNLESEIHQGALQPLTILNLHLTRPSLRFKPPALAG